MNWTKRSLTSMQLQLLKEPKSPSCIWPNEEVDLLSTWPHVLVYSLDRKYLSLYIIVLYIYFAVYSDLASYNASKHAVVGYTRSFQLMPHICNVRVNAICPYWVDTDIIKNVTGEDGGPSVFHEYVTQCPYTEMSTVVEGILTCFVDSTKNGKKNIYLRGLYVILTRI